jgi:drug/metabolite transporter (DMT)-like permease
MQQREARRAPKEMAMRLGLLGHLLQRPLWLLGNVVGIAGFALQFLALRHGALALVQPLLVTGLVFALGGAAALDHRRLSRLELLSMAATVGGLVLFVASSRPGPGLGGGTSAGWIALGVATAVSVSALIVAARRWRRWRALNLGIAAGIVGGVLSALIERTAHLVSGGLAHTFASWAPYALIACGVFSILLTQSAYQAGDIRTSLPALTVAEPITAILIGQLLFGEQLAQGGLAVIGDVAGLTLMTAGVFGLGQAAGAEVAGPGPRAEAPATPASAEAR